MIFYNNSDSLTHHGIKGQKWGVRNGPPYPLHQKEARRLKKASKTKKDVDDIVNSLSTEDKRFLNVDPDVKEDAYLSLQQGEYVMHRILKKYGNIPVSFFDMLDDGNTINLAMATRSGYRGKGYAKESAIQAMDWLNNHPKQRNGRDVVWGVKVDNKASIAIAKKLGFVEDPDSYNDGWINYVNKL